MANIAYVRTANSIRSLRPIVPALECDPRCAICERRDEDVIGEWLVTYQGEGASQVRVDICPDCRKRVKDAATR